MIIKLALAITIMIAAPPLLAQKSLVSIRAGSISVDIREGDHLYKNRWTISPEVKPDIFTTSAKGEKVTFYTDKDSLTIKITPTTNYQFIILLNDSVKALTQVVYKPGYLDILKGASAFNPGDQRPVPKFEYQEKGNPNLVALRKEFNLDSIAGGAGEINKILNLLHWVHNLVPHDGKHENPAVNNAMSMIALCKQENRGLNCRGLATVLNECYLAMGIKSRFVTCMPKDTIFDDCHVVNLVYLEGAKKWVWIDPTNNAYVMNEKGELLSIAEVRERIINGKPLILNPDANWNNREAATKEDYLYNYMAKNLYRLQCPLVSEYDSETWRDGKQITFVDLLPLDAYQQAPVKTVATNPANGTTFTHYKTNNPALFWANPE